MCIRDSMISAANVVSVTNMVNATTCANAKIPKGQNTKMPTCQNVKVSKCPNAKMSKCQNVKMTKCQNDKVPKAKIPKCYTALLNWTLQMAEAIGVHHRRRKNTVCYKTPLAHLVQSAWLEGEPVWVYVCVRPGRCKRACVLIRRAWSHYRTRSFSDYSGNDFVLLLLLI